MLEVKFVQIAAHHAGQRLDNYLIRVLKGVPKSLIYRLIRSGQIRVNKKRAQPALKLNHQDILRIPPIRTALGKPTHRHKAYEIFLKKALLYEDPDIMVLNKPAGMAVHGGSGVSLGVIEAYRALRPDLPYLELVHRLDKATSGCLVLAKKRSILKALQAEFEKRTVQKIYLALLEKPWHGEMQKTVCMALRKITHRSGERMVQIHQAGKLSETIFKLVENFSTSCLVEAIPLTGRTHQIRVHSVAIGHAVVGDHKYQCIKGQTKRLYLHAQAIRFMLNGRLFHFVAPLNEHFLEKLHQLRNL